MFLRTTRPPRSGADKRMRHLRVAHRAAGRTLALEVLEDRSLLSSGPTVIMVTPSVNEVTQINAGTNPTNPNAGFELRINYSAAMNLSSTPTVDITVYDGIMVYPLMAMHVLYAVPSKTFWTSATTYKAAIGVNLFPPYRPGPSSSVSVSVSGATDAAGNLQVPFAGSVPVPGGFFYIDTVDPPPALAQATARRRT